MTEEKRLEEAMMGFIKGGDNRDVVLLDRVLHNDFRVTNNGFMGKPGVMVIDKRCVLRLRQLNDNRCFR